jgi:tetratricopeptide (TPR) repeat protein
LADWGAVLMAQIQLSDFPSNEWTASQDISQYAQAQAWLERAVRLDPFNRAANHRLGLIALQSRDFNTATRYLEAALLEDASHPGVIKNLGYAYVWAGLYDQALPLLAQIPEAGQELGYYVDWWKAQGRADLAQNAAQMRARLAGGTLLRSRPLCASTSIRTIKFPLGSSL